jgi:hypothetical protein
MLHRRKHHDQAPPEALGRHYRDSIVARLWTGWLELSLSWQSTRPATAIRTIEASPKHSRTPASLTNGSDGDELVRDAAQNRSWLIRRVVDPVLGIQPRESGRAHRSVS